MSLDNSPPNLPGTLRQYAASNVESYMAVIQDRGFWLFYERTPDTAAYYRKRQSVDARSIERVCFIHNAFGRVIGMLCRSDDTDDTYFVTDLTGRIVRDGRASYARSHSSGDGEIEVAFSQRHNRSWLRYQCGIERACYEELGREPSGGVNRQRWRRRNREIA